MLGRNASQRPHRASCNGASILSVALVAGCLAIGCGPDNSSTADADTSGEVDSRPDADLQADAARCPIDWEKTPSTEVAPIVGPVYYSRPFFTTCKDGVFYYSTWMSYDEPITEYTVETEANRVHCRSGTCRDGMCEDDQEFIESMVESADQVESGFFSMYSADCEVCNPNNALYSPWEVELPPNVICDGGSLCCDNPMPNDGPCHAEEPDWSFVAHSKDERRILRLSAYGTMKCTDIDCQYSELDLCEAVRGGSCVPDVSTLQQIDWDNDDCNGTYVGLLVYNDDYLTVSKATIWMGTRDDFWNLGANNPECGPEKATSLLSMTYFTCSGAALVQTMDDRWFKAVWIHRYDPSDCDDKPCWMARHEKLPVEFLLTELPGDPALSPAGQ